MAVDLASAHVIVIGALGPGGAVLAGLAAAGVGTISIVDDRSGGRGRLAVDDAADALAALAPHVTIERHGIRFAPGRTFDLLLDADLLIDGSNDLDTRYLANDAAAVRAIPMVWASVTGDTGQVGVAWDERGADYRDFDPERPEPHDSPPAPPSRAALAAAGELMASYAIALLTDAGGTEIGEVTVFDVLTAHTDSISYHRDPAAARPGSLEERTALREPDPARSVSAEQLAKLLAGPTTEGVHETPPLLLDVRERPEASFASLPASVLIPLGELPDRLDELSRDASIVVYCHHGVRSARALDVLEKAGFTRVRHLTGGLDAWSVKVDPEVPRY